MKKKIFVSIISFKEVAKRRLSIALMLSLIVVASRSYAQTNPRYVALQGSVLSALYTPDAALNLPPPHVALIFMQRTSNYLSTAGCTELSRRGFMVLCMNASFYNNEAEVDWNQIAIDVRRGVDFVRSQAGISKVVLVGYSAGAPTMTFYQAVAENGVSYCNGANKIVPCGTNLQGLPKADGLVLMDPTSGSATFLRSLNAAVVNQNKPSHINPNLDPFSPQNGYNPNGPTTYSEKFKKKYFEAQSDRMNELIDTALDIQLEMAKGTYPFPDNDVFRIARAGAGGGGNPGGQLYTADLSLNCCTLKPQKLLKDDGTIVTQLVKSVRLPDLSIPAANGTFNNGVRLLTINSFLSANAIRSINSEDGIDWCSSNASSECAIQQISVPILIEGMGAYSLFPGAEQMFNMAKSQDKDFIVIEGAVHGLSGCTPNVNCTGPAGGYPNARKNLFDYIAKWLNDRF